MGTEPQRGPFVLEDIDGRLARIEESLARIEAFVGAVEYALVAAGKNPLLRGLIPPEIVSAVNGG